MFGFVVANTEKLNDEQLQRYRALYCGLCRKLGERHGKGARMILTYDLVFLILVLSSVLDGEDLMKDEASCIAHPVKRRSFITDTFTEYAADMNVALAYYNCMDDWSDDNSIKARMQAQLLGKGLAQTKKLYPRQTDAMSRCLHELDEAEKHNETNPEIPANIFGELMGELFRFDEFEESERLYDFGCALGRFIYLTDAFVDLKNDIKRQKYNPLIRYKREDILPMLEIQMAQCVELFDLLPVQKDRDICENILYSGIWTKVEMMKQQEAKNHHE